MGNKKKKKEKRKKRGRVRRVLSGLYMKEGAAQKGMQIGPRCPHKEERVRSKILQTNK